MSGDKVAIITAGGSGMGAGAAKKLAEDGFRVAICRRPEKAKHSPMSWVGSGLPGQTSPMTT